MDRERIRAHVCRLQERYPPIDPGSADYTVADVARVRARFGQVLDYMARVEMEVERNVLELAVLLPGVSDTDRLFYHDVWGPQEARHGVLLDTLGQHLGLAPATPNLAGVAPRIRILGALARLPAVQQVIRLLYYLTGAATERSAVLAYQAMSDQLGQMGETAIKHTVVDAIKTQEPGHFAFYRLSAEQMIQTRVLAPWQLYLARILRTHSFSLVGAHTPAQRAGIGGVIVNLGLDLTLDGDTDTFTRDIVRVETQLLWARDNGLPVPRYALSAVADAIERYRHTRPHDRAGRHHPTRQAFAADPAPAAR